MRSQILIITAYLTAVIIFVLDRFLKKLVVFIEPEKYSILGDWLKFNFAQNYNIAFSLPFYGVWLELLIGIIIIFLIFFWLKTIKKDKDYLSGSILFIIFLGAVSNYFDRVKYGFVVDYIDLKYFTVFNFADCMIVSGIVILLFAIDKKGKIV